MIWVQEPRNAAYWDWLMEIIRNNPPCVDTLCLIDDNNPEGKSAKT